MDAGINWTLPSYAAVMKALLQAGEASRGLALWEEIIKRGLQPDAATGDMALSMAGRTKQWETAESIYNSMMRWGLEPYIAGLGVVIEGRYVQSNPTPILHSACMHCVTYGESGFCVLLSDFLSSFRLDASGER